jgi:hypothetical protein
MEGTRAKRGEEAVYAAGYLVGSILPSAISYSFRLRLDRLRRQDSASVPLRRLKPLEPISKRQTGLDHQTIQKKSLPGPYSYPYRRVLPAVGITAPQRYRYPINSKVALFALAASLT